MARNPSSLKMKVAGCRILRQLEVSMVFTGSFVFPLNYRFKSLRFTLNGYYLVRFWAHWMLNVRSIDVG